MSHDLQPSARGAVPPFRVMDVLAAAEERQATHGDMIALCVGQPGTPAPKAVRDAVAASLDREVLGYTTARGNPDLRAALADHYRATYGAAVDPDDVILTSGSSGGFSTLLLAAFDAGDRVAMVRPGYPAYRNTMQAMGIEVVEVEAGHSERFQPTVAMLEAVDGHLDGVIVASPSNPTGTVIDADELEAIARWCEASGTLLISDEIYHGISYGRRCASAREFSDQAVVMGSFSKFHSMTGWRIGWAIVPQHLRRPMDLLQANLAICAPAVSQVAGLAALGADARAELEAHVARYATNRDVLLRRLPEIGVHSFAPPDGAFYAYCDISHLTNDSLAWCEQALQATGVAITSGVDFDLVDGRRFIRLSFCGTTPALDEAMDRLVAYIG